MQFLNRGQLVRTRRGNLAVVTGAYIIYGHFYEVHLHYISPWWQTLFCRRRFYDNETQGLTLVG